MVQRDEQMLADLLVVRLLNASKLLRVGIYGGAFDPVHHGHLRSAVEVRQQFALDELRLVPSGHPPHRVPAYSSAEQRLAMLRLAVAGVDGVIIDEREIHSQQPSYSYNTIVAMQAEMPNVQLVLVIGMDQFCVFETWHRWQEILQTVELVVMERPGENLDPRAQALSCSAEALSITLFPVTQLDISSSRIRQDLQNRMEIHFLLPYAVHQHIIENKLYGGCTDSNE